MYNKNLHLKEENNIFEKALLYICWLCKYSSGSTGISLYKRQKQNYEYLLILPYKTTHILLEVKALVSNTKTIV